MTRWTPPVAALILALIGAVLLSRTPLPRPADAAEAAFSAERALTDVRAIAQAPHPVGSAEHARVRDYLLRRMTALSLQPESQTGALSPNALQRLQNWNGGAAPPTSEAINLIGVLPGRDRAAPAVMMMAHYDSAWGSPGAADDSAGVAAILESVRALKARGGGERDLIVLITDAEELNLDGARAFFSEHPLRDRVGAVINLEARGGGGRGAMFESGPAPAETIALFSRAARRADGGTTSNSLAATIYAAMPNGSDFTIARERGLAGVNIAFIGRPDQYHSPTSTPENLDPGAVQNIGSQALETAYALINAPELPQAGREVVYADLPFVGVISHPPAAGWLILIAALLLTGLAAWGEQRRSGRPPAALGRGVLRGVVAGVWFLAAAAIAMQAVRVLGGPLESRAVSADMYYTLLRRLPLMEIGCTLAALAALFMLMGGRDAVARRATAAACAVLAVIAAALGGSSGPTALIPTAVLGVIAVAGALALPRPAMGLGEPTGLVLLTLALGAILQAVAPGTAFVLLWPGLLAALAMAAHALIAQRVPARWSPAPSLIAAVLGGAWLLYMGHLVYLGIGSSLPAAGAALALPFAMLIAPLFQSLERPRPLMLAAAVCLALGAGVSLSARIVEPLPPPAAGGPS